MENDIEKSCKALDKARARMRATSDGCTELSCMYHGKNNRGILNEERAKVGLGDW